MKALYSKWMEVLALASYAAAVFMLAGGKYWPGIALIGAGSALMAAGKSKSGDPAHKEYADPLRLCSVIRMSVWDQIFPLTAIK